MAGANGKSLLDYCSSGAGYYSEPNNMTALVELRRNRPHSR
ncbi:hypothetical protein [Neorhizobium galegae]|nr:hypothetical protein [Neorhizobium galegae]